MQCLAGLHGGPHSPQCCVFVPDQNGEPHRATKPAKRDTNRKDHWLRPPPVSNPCIRTVHVKIMPRPAARMLRRPAKVLKPIILGLQGGRTCPKGTCPFQMKLVSAHIEQRSQSKETEIAEVTGSGHIFQQKHIRIPSTRRWPGGMRAWVPCAPLTSLSMSVCGSATRAALAPILRVRPRPDW